MVGFTNDPIRVDGHTLEDCGDSLNDTVAGYENGNDP